MTRNELDKLCTAIRLMRRRSERLDTIRGKIEELRDKSRLQTTKSLYQTILDLFDDKE